MNRDTSRLALRNGLINSGRTSGSRLDFVSAREQVVQPGLSLVPPFGTSPNNINHYPNDVIQADVYNAVDRYLESDFRLQSYTTQGGLVSVDVEDALTRLGYTTGKYQVQFNFLRNLLGSGDGLRLRVQEISADGLEVRVIPAVDSQNSAEFQSFFAADFFSLPKPIVLPDLYLYKDALTRIQVFDYVQDKFTFRDFPYSIIFKLTSPASGIVRIGDSIWLAQEVSQPSVDTITITPPRLGAPPIQIGAPNWECLIEDRTNLNTDYKTWDDLLSTNPTTSQALVRKLFSGSLLEGIPLNYDFREFGNFIHFGSAEDRLHNFKYKMELLEFYDARINTLNPTPTIPEASSSYSLSNVVDATNKKNNILGSFDAYEEHLYYASSSYESGSFGVFYATTWPKSNTSAPYTNYSVTSSQATEWFTTIIKSASIFDSLNPHALTKTIPAHVHEEEVNQQYVLMVSMIGHYFDIIYAYVKGLSDIHDRNESLFEGFSKDLVFHVAQSLGVDFENGNTIDDLWKYFLGTDQNGVELSIYEGEAADKTKETWKRIVNNLPYLLKTKGTERGLRALINCFGIPSTILRIREFGGPEPTFDNRTDWSYDRFSYSTIVGFNSGSGADVNQKISAPWKALAETGGLPKTVELRVRMAPSQSKDQSIITAGNWSVQAVNGNSLKLTVGASNVTFSSSIYDGTFHHLAITSNNSNKTTLSARKVNYGKVVSTQTGSVNAAWGGAGTALFIPASTTVLPAASHSAAIFTGSVQELRYWTTELADRILDNHALAPSSFQGNDADLYSGSTGSFNELAFRLTAGADSSKFNYSVSSSISSSHPNQLITTFNDGSSKLATFTNFQATSSVPLVETDFLEWPDLGANRTIANKIRIDSTIVAGDNQLFRNTSVVRSLGDDNPPDSSRLGVYLSPTDEVNQDIAEQFGGLSIDDYIGDPAYYELVNYPALEGLKYQYTKKYSSRNNSQAYIRLLAYFDASLFQLIKKLVPYRANTQVGLVIEPTILDRSKWPSQAPSFEELHWSASLEHQPTPGGFVQDGDGEPFRNMEGYVQEGVIAANGADYMLLRSFVEDGGGEPTRNLEGYVEGGVIELEPTLPTVEYDYVIFDETIHASPSLTGDTDQFGRPLLNRTGSQVSLQYGTAYDEIKLRESQYGRDLAAHGSQYVFMTYATSGSGSTRSEPYWITSSRYDYHDPFNAVVLDSRRSEISNVADHPYSGDIFKGKGLSFLYTSSVSYNLSTVAGLTDERWTSHLGLRLNDPLNTADAKWSMSAGNPALPQGLTLIMNCSGHGAVNASNHALLDAFFYNTAYPETTEMWYQVEVAMNTNMDGGPGSGEGRLEFGHVGSSRYQNLGTLPEGTGRQFVLDNVQKFIVKPNGPHLVLSSSLAATVPDGRYAYTPIVRVTCLNYRAQVQDFHLRDSYGMRNARYDGCKMTSVDWNIDSPDTSDGGPVVTITLGGGTDLVTNPTSRGTFEVRGTSEGAPTTTRSGTRSNIQRR